MITEDYVSFETAKLLKEKGFNERGLCVYTVNSKELITFGDWVENSCLLSHLIAAPTLQMAIKWLREEKGIAIVPILSSILDSKKFLWDVKIIIANTNESYSQGWIYENYENAVEAAIKYCLINLI